jgi:DNA helicase-2/ATP-dependent DNA helicase PcrA
LGRDVFDAWSFAGRPLPCPVRVGTLHALALRILRAAGQLKAFPVAPRVLDDWEMDNIFDVEFGVVAGLKSLVRRRDIRLDHEAFWSTGAWLPPGLPSPDPAITAAERRAFEAYYRSRSSLYCYLLPSDITRRCLEYLSSMPTEVGLPVPLAHLIVDEYQDLNPVDLALIGEIRSRGAHLFAAGDDDQSIYFFRYALPAGFQEFDTAYPGATTCVLQHCFRCPTEVLDPSLALMAANAPDTRIDKGYVATPSLAEPPVVGSIQRWYFQGWRREADAIAASCRALMDAGMPADEIAILLSSRPALEKAIAESLDAASVPYELGEHIRFTDELPGRVAAAIVRLVVDQDDYVAVRTLIGAQRRVGVGTCNEIAAWLIASNLRFGDLIPWPDKRSLSARARGAVECVAVALEAVAELEPVSLLSAAIEVVATAVETVVDSAAATAWRDFSAELPQDMTLDEVRRLFASTTPRAERAVLEEVQNRLGIPVDEEASRRVRVLTLHGSKGLTFEVVFIPALEQGLLPSERDMPYPGLVQQAARLLFVGMTRARLLVALSMAGYRMVQGTNVARRPTPFVGSLSGRFEYREAGLSANEVAATMEAREARLLV